MTRLTLDRLTKRYTRGDAAAVDRVSLDVASGEIVALLGPSGCGKTTTLKLVAGLLQPESGDIRFDDTSVLPVSAEKRGAVMVFQNHLLFPHMTVAQNVGFGLKMRGVHAADVATRVTDMLDLVQLSGYEQRKPKSLSGGQQQRVALARALITDPNVLLLDEPLSNLDAHLRDEMRSLILSVQRRFGTTTLVVTHDQQEAVLLADRIALLFDGVVQQIGPPHAFYRRPATERVARFFGGVNFVPARWDGQVAESVFGRIPVRDCDLPPGPATLTVRPERLRLGADGVPGTVTERVFMGTHVRLTVRVGDAMLQAVSSAPAYAELAVGDRVGVSVAVDDVWLLSAEPS